MACELPPRREIEQEKATVNKANGELDYNGCFFSFVVWRVLHNDSTEGEGS